MSRTISRVVTLLLLLAVWVPTFAAQDAGQFKERLSFTDRTDSKKIELNVPASARFVNVQVEAALRSGAFIWTLRDAAGNVRLRGAGNGEGRYEGSTGKIDAVTGVWTLEIRFKDATGSYDIVWTTG
ncbi:MAG TPA: hypothetical protein VF544_22670 [Pyrinomonadaceae bacterium]|jgi:hypothetical protein